MKFDNVTESVRGFRIANIGNKHGIVDKNYNLITPLKYDLCSYFNETFAKVSISGKYGLINKKGIEICPIKYDNISNYSNIAAVQLNGKWGYVNGDGIEFCGLKYDECNAFNSGFAIVKLNGKYGVVNELGHQICPIKYDDCRIPIVVNNVKYIPISINNKWGFMDIDGFEVYDMIFDSYFYNNTQIEVTYGKQRHVLSPEYRYIRSNKKFKINPDVCKSNFKIRFVTDVNGYVLSLYKEKKLVEMIKLDKIKDILIDLKLHDEFKVTTYGISTLIGVHMKM